MGCTSSKATQVSPRLGVKSPRGKGPADKLPTPKQRKKSSQFERTGAATPKSQGQGQGDEQPGDEGTLPQRPAARSSSSSDNDKRESGTNDQETRAPRSSGSHTARAAAEDDLIEFSVEDIKKATRSFAYKLGEGGFGLVFKGKIRVEGEGDVSVAVKVLKQDSKQGFKEWQTEVRMLGELRHPNLVRLYGYCCNTVECMLVYEFCPQNCFAVHLFPPLTESGKSKIPPLSFRKRMKLLLGAAEGLAYLHEGTPSGQSVIYRDFKTSNILVDKDFNAKLADFGLARDGPDRDETHVSTDIVGTSGYLAPEYIERGHASTRCDVYSFGVVMMEVLTGHKVALFPEKGVCMIDWVRREVDRGPEDEGFATVMDKNLKGRYCSKAVKLVYTAAKACLQDDPKARPGMGKVVEALKVAYKHAVSDAYARQQVETGKGSGPLH